VSDVSTVGGESPSEQAGQADSFLSYAREDRAFVVRLESCRDIGAARRPTSSRCCLPSGPPCRPACRSRRSRTGADSGSVSPERKEGSQLERGMGCQSGSWSSTSLCVIRRTDEPSALITKISLVSLAP
jgi:hypothetical protein